MTKQLDRTAQTRADFQEAFWRLYADKPIEQITVQQVCTLAGYNRGTFYLHYHDIYELLDEVEGYVLEGMTECVKQCIKLLKKDSSKLALLTALKDVVIFYERNKREIIILLGAQGDPSFTPKLKDRLKPLWREYIVGQDTERSEQEIDLYLEYTLSGGLYMISRWLQDPGDITTAQMGHLIYNASIRNVSTWAADDD